MSECTALLFDIGNTRLKWGLYDKHRFSRTGTISHAELRNHGYSRLTARLPRRVDRVFASNVAGSTIANRLSGVVAIHCDAKLHFAHSQKDAFGVRCGYRQPRRLGVDRWVAMIAGRQEFRSAFCVVDAGTAVTIDAVDRTGQHLGGQILPGVQLMGDALRDNTREIPDAEKTVRDPAPGNLAFGRHTDAAVNFGALNAVCGAIERSAKMMRAAGHRPKIVLTGGDASRILKQLDGKGLHRPNLVLQGLAIIACGD